MDYMKCAVKNYVCPCESASGPPLGQLHLFPKQSASPCYGPRESLDVAVAITLTNFHMKKIEFYFCLHL